MQPFRTVSNRAKAQGTLIDRSNTRPSLNLSSDHARPRALAVIHNRALESSRQSQHAVRASDLFLIPGPRNPSESVAKLVSPSLSMFALLLTPVAVVAAALGVWRLGADPGWTNQFFISDGLLSHWQAWFAVGIGAHTSGRGLNKWLEIQNAGAKGVTGRREASRRSSLALTPGIARR
jgi:hypothetical protein